MKKYIVYKHTNLLNNKVYIGITCQKVNRRWRDGYGYKHCTYFYHAIQKYGWDNFKHEILFQDLTKEQAQEKEIGLIKQYKSNNYEFGYNLLRGGNLSTLEFHHSEETKRQISKTMKQKGINIGNKNPNFGISPTNAKKIICLETGIVYNSMMQAGKELGLDFRLISAVCRGKRHTTGGLHFMYWKGN